MALQDEQPIDVARTVAALRGGRRLIALFACALALAALAATALAPERFRAGARILHDAPAGTAAETSERTLETSRRLVETPAVLGAAARALRADASSLRDAVEASIERNADILVITATSGGGERAAAIANAVAEAYLADRARAERSALADARERLAANLDQLPVDSPQRAPLQLQLADLVTREATAGSELRLVERARPPEAAASPLLRNALLALVAGIVLGVLCALALDRMRPRVGDRRELARLAGVPVLAELPARGRGAAGASTDLRHFADDDAGRGLLAAVLLELPPGPGRTILVTSAVPGDGTPAVAALLAYALGRAAHRTLLVSGDLRSRALDKLLGLDGAPGLADALAARDSAGAAIGTLRGAGRVEVLPSGRGESGGFALWRPGRLAQVMAALAERRYDCIVVAAPPVTSAPELRLFARHAEAAILVCDLDRLTVAELAAARETGQLDARVRMLGVVAWHGSRDAGHRAAPSAAHAAAEPAEPAGDGDGAAERVLARMHQAGRPLRVGELRGALPRASTAELRAELDRLIATGTVVRRGAGLRGDPYRFELASTNGARAADEAQRSGHA